MAFNPLSSFRKYPKVWMSGVLLLCMLTFVFCTGAGGDLSDRILSWIRPRADDYVKIGGKRYTYQDFEELKEQRNIANDFMRTTSDFGVKQLEKRIKSAPAADKENAKAKEQIGLLMLIRDDLFTKLMRDPRYFSGGTKLDELIDFVVWLQVADQYDIQLSDDDVRKLVNRDVHAEAWGFDEGFSREVQMRVRQSHYKAEDPIIMKALRNEFRVRIAQLTLVDRYAGGPLMPTKEGAVPTRDYYAMYVGLYLHMPKVVRVSLTPEQLFAYYNKTLTQLDFDIIPVSLEQLAEKTPVPDLETLKSFFHKNEKNPYNPNSETPGFVMPAQVEIEYLMADPNMDYYKRPAQVATTLQMLPPLSFNPAHQLPVPFNPVGGAYGGPLMTGLAWEASLQTNLDALKRQHQADWDRYFASLIFLADQKGSAAKVKTLLDGGPPTFKYSASPRTTSYFWSPDLYDKNLHNPKPAAVAGLVGALGQTQVGLLGDGTALYKAAELTYKGHAYLEPADKVKPLQKADWKQRSAIGSDLILSGLQTVNLGGEPFTAASKLLTTHNQAAYLPVAGFVADELRGSIESKLAQQWMNKAMLDIKNELQSVTGNNPEKRFRERLESVRQKYSRKQEVNVPRLAAAGLGVAERGMWVSGVKYGKTTKLRNEYDVETDPGLKAFLDSFDKQRLIINTIEGRSGKPEMLKEGDFAKLFFGTDAIGLGSAEAYVASVWPPPVIPKKKVDEYVANTKPAAVQLFDDSEQPIIYWKNIKKGPEKLTWKPDDKDFMELVVKQYKMDKARETILKVVKELANKIKDFQRQEKEDVFALKLRDLALKEKQQILSLNRVAILKKTSHRASDFGEEVADYEPFVLKRDALLFPREDTVKLLLSMNKNQSAPIDAKIGELDDLNKSLFLPNLKADEKKATYQVQVLTNKPRSVYYIVTLAKERLPSKDEFFSNILAKAFGGKHQNRFVDLAQEELGKEVLADVMKQLRQSENHEVVLSEGAKKQIDTDNAAK